MSELKANEIPASPPLQDRLLDAAEQVVARDGVQRLTLEAVAKQAGVSKGGLLYHYPSKSALVVAIVERLAKRFEQDQDRLFHHDEVSKGSFARAYLVARMQPLASEEEVVHTALLAAAGTDSHYLDPFRARSVEWQTRLETDGIDPAIAHIVRLAIDGLCLSRLLNMPVPEGELRQRIIDKLLDMTRP